MSLVRIVVADDHDIVRHGLRTLLETRQGWEVIGEASDGRQAVDIAKRLKPDVVVLDISMPELNGLEAARQILHDVPRTEVLILTMHRSEQVVRELLQAGARGYLLKNDAARELVAAVEALSQHQPFFTSEVSEIVLQGYRRPSVDTDQTQTPSARLTVREREIVQLLAEGKSNKEVATALGISVKTAETHRTNIMNKLNLHSLSELVRYAVRNNMIEP
ncbi:MAG TPA: response regulator transcription factor [Terriglobales bacterium]|nr:response regulator transcription factor [Terriglobales bacterium]